MSDNFHVFQEAVDAQYERMLKEGSGLFVVDIDKDEIWDAYLAAFPAGSNPIYRERTAHDCQCCKHFVRRMGRVVTMTASGALMTIWDAEVADPNYQAVADVMDMLIRSKAVKEPFFFPEPTIGVRKNNAVLADGSIETWNHFECAVPKALIRNKHEIPTLLSDLRGAKDVFLRSCEEILPDAVQDVIDLIKDKSLYRGEEHLRTLQQFQALQKGYADIKDPIRREIGAWNIASTESGAVTRIRNTSIGTLLVDLSEGMDLDSAVKRYEAVVAPTTYKRPKALVTPAMIKKAQEKVQELGMIDSLPRRHATLTDITVNNVIWADRNAVKAMKGNVFDDMIAESTRFDPAKLKTCIELDADTFISTLGQYSSVEALVENRLQGNLMSLIAPEHPEAPNMLKWHNNFSWSYNGDIADSMREEVVARGGSVTGVLRFTHAWNHEGQNQSLMDLHVFFPDHKGTPKDGSVNDEYGNLRRVGWNNRKDSATGGVQDVDYTAAPGKTVPLENITFPSTKRMPEGTYQLKIHNWRSRNPNTQGFKAEVEFDGQIFEYEYRPAVKHKEWIDVAHVTLQNGQFTIEHKLDSSTSSREVWGLNTMQFSRVSTIMNSPNHWDGEETGNKHLFFILDGCKQPGTIRGFYNEFLTDKLRDHRKVFEMLGSKVQVAESDQQLSGLGFSSTQRNHAYFRLTQGKSKQVVKVNF